MDVIEDAAVAAYAVSFFVFYTNFSTTLAVGMGKEKLKRIKK